MTPVHEIEADQAGKCERLTDCGLTGLRHAQQQMGDQRHEDLDPHGVLGGSEEMPDLEVLLDPFEEQFDLPALLVELSDLAGRGVEIIGQDADDFAGGDAHGDLAYRVGHGVAPRPGHALRQQTDAVREDGIIVSGQRQPLASSAAHQPKS